MRVIKFRAWGRQAKRMYTVDDLKNLWTLNNHEGDAQTIPNVIVVNQSYRGEDLELVVDQDCDLMQYTGLNDKSGKEICEGDILDWPIKQRREDGIVVFEDGGFWLIQDYIPHLQSGGRYMPSKKYREIIGNIYENPELIKNGSTKTLDS